METIEALVKYTPGPQVALKAAKITTVGKCKQILILKYLSWTQYSP